MSSEKEHWIKNPWVVGLVLIFLTPPITALWDIVKGLPYYTTTVKIWQWLIGFEIKLWWLVLYILIMGLIRAIRDELKKKNYTQSHPYIPRTYLRFTAVKYGNFKWKWTWHQDILTKDIEISKLLPVCPVPACNNNALHYERTDTNKEGRSSISIPYHRCSICNAEYLIEKQVGEVEFYIKQLIDRDSFKETTEELPEFCYTGN